ncbi:MAG TPA: hypothetical protein VE130_16630 [Nitrososphaeraceae archaeon]|nr:hypothetical protein [Nitrososphaeraceae archaeon]
MDDHTDVTGDSSASITDQNLKIIGRTTENLNWSTICDSRVGARTREGLVCGNVVAEYNDSLVLINFGSSTWHGYLIPKSTVKGYDGKLLYLNFSYDFLTSYAC